MGLIEKLKFGKMEEFQCYDFDFFDLLLFIKFLQIYIKIL